MKAAKRKPDDQTAAERRSRDRVLDPGETRAVILASAALLVFLYLIKFILLPFVLAAIIAYICTPPIDWAARRTGWPRILFAVAAFIVLLGTGGFVGYFATQRAVDELRGIVTDLQGLIEKFVSEALGPGPIRLFGHSLSAESIADGALARLSDWLGQADKLAMLTGYSLAAIMGVFLTVVLLFYFLVGGRRVTGGLLWMVPPHRRPLVTQIWQRLDPVLLRYFIGVLAVVIYATIASYIGLGFFLGIHHAVLLALLTGILETVPVIGPTSAAVIAGLISLRTATGFMSIVNYALYATALRLSIDQLFGPVVLGTAAHVHPVLIIFCFLSGGILFGIPGVILAVPVALLIKATLATFYGDDSD